jgi:hypothetical protein
MRPAQQRPVDVIAEAKKLALPHADISSSVAVSSRRSAYDGAPISIFS